MAVMFAAMDDIAVMIFLSSVYSGVSPYCVLFRLKLTAIQQNDPPRINFSGPLVTKSKFSGASSFH